MGKVYTTPWTTSYFLALPLGQPDKAVSFAFQCQLPRGPWLAPRGPRPGRLGWHRRSLAKRRVGVLGVKEDGGGQLAHSPGDDLRNCRTFQTLLCDSYTLPLFQCQNVHSRP